MGFERVIALIVSLLECTYMRVGNECYASANHTYGLTTLRSRHAEVHGSSVRIKFVGKGGRRTEVELTDPRVSRMIRRCQDLPGQLLFRYEDDDGALHPVTSTDVNDYLRDRTGLDITAKTFRTWTGTLLAAVGFAALSPPKTRRAEQAGVKAVTTTVAETLHNTPAVARASYIHPVVIDSYLDGSL
jgi:DNA topoisomerase-1